MNTPPPKLLYDGDCPLCSRYRDFLQLRESFGLELLDARQNRDLVAQLRDRGFDVDQGMILLEGDRIHHGADAALRIQELLAGRSKTARFSLPLLRIPGLMRLLYPIFKGTRWASLRILGRDPHVDA